jgi:segregation and condensation protein B
MNLQGNSGERRMELEQETALIESILFLETEPIDIKTLCRISALSEEVVREGLLQLKNRYSESSSGIDCLEIGGGFLLIPKHHLWENLRERYGKRNENRLSRAALETLAIIAYSQPVTRGEIENLRGVSADGMIRLLLSRNLIKEVGKKDAPGRPIQFGTTKEFLKAFKLNSIADLPKLDETEHDRFELNG